MFEAHIHSLQSDPMGWLVDKVVRWWASDESIDGPWNTGKVLTVQKDFIVFRSPEGIDYVPWARINCITVPEPGDV